MASLDMRQVIGDLLKNTWSNTGNVPIAWPNRDFTPPKGAAWLRVSFADGDSRQITIGATNNFYRSVGVLYVQVFTPADTGDYEGRRLADELAGVFRSQHYDGATDEVIRFRSPTIRTIGVDGVYYQVNCEVPFVRDTLV
jgi:hypothetical protein